MIASQIDRARVPNHVACVMDGNGRWAEQRGLKRTDGHSAGEGALFDTVLAALDLGINWLTVYAFSTENWKRPPTEVLFLMRLNEMILTRRIDELDERGVRVRFLGRRDRRVPPSLARAMDAAVARTEKNRTLTLTFAFNYGGRAELIDAMKRMADDGVPARSISEKKVKQYLYQPDMPDPDLVIRTSGEYRISNFLLWEMAYSELVFTDVLWPDFGRDELHAMVLEFQQRDRRFGGVKPSGIADTIVLDDDVDDRFGDGFGDEFDDGFDDPPPSPPTAPVVVQPRGLSARIASRLVPASMAGR